MIESFSDFLKKSNRRNIFEGYSESASEELYIPQESVDTGGSLDKEFWEKVENRKIETPKCVSDDRYLIKISRIVIRAMRKAFGYEYYAHPFVVKIEGNDGVLICGENSFLALTKSGIDKKVYFFTQDPIENKISPEFTVSTKKLGFLAMMDTLIFNLKNMSENSGKAITEAKERVPRAIPEIDTTPVKKSDLAVGKVVDAIMGPKVRGHRDSDFAINKTNMNDFLSQWELFSDGDIFAMMTEEEFEEDHKWYDIQQKLFFKTEKSTGKRVLNENNGRKVIGLIHNILCGVEKGYELDQIEQMRECWFWSAGKSGKLATDVDDATGIVTVTECEEVLREEIDLLDDDIRMEEEFVCAMLNYIKEGGKNGTTEDLEGCMATHRGLLVSGIGGIGKTAAIKKAVERTGAQNGVHYVKFGSVGTAQAIYKQLYKFNNMVIIYDDTQSLWEDEDKINLFKRATSETEDDRLIDTSNSNALTRESSGDYYDVKNNKYTRQQIYKKEIGTISNYERKVWIEKKMDELQRNHKAAWGDKPDFERLDDAETRELATKEFKEYEKSKQQSLYPNQFTFNGFIVFITNKSLSSFENSKSLRDHWGALTRRLSMIDLSPRPKILWAWLKEKVWADINNPDLEDSMRILPSVGKAENSSIENVMDFLEKVVEGEFNTSMKTYGKVTFSTFTNLRKYINSKNNTERRWKELIKRDMLLSVGTREYT